MKKKVCLIIFITIISIISFSKFVNGTESLKNEGNLSDVQVMKIESSQKIVISNDTKSRK